MPSLLELTNCALSELGKLPVEAIGDSDSSIIVSNKILELYKEILLEANWTWAIVYIENSSPETTNYSPDFVYSYQLPGNFGRFFRFANTGSQWPYYEFVDGMLLAQTLPVQYYYIRNDVPFEYWPPLPARELILYAASKCAMSQTQNVQLAAYLMKEYQDAKNRAITENDMQRSIMQTPYNDFDRIQFV